MTNSDSEILENMTAEFTKTLISNKPEQIEVYKELAKRIAELINAEIYWRTNYEDTREMMQFWGARNQ
jgi:hypothetical protein